MSRDDIKIKLCYWLKDGNCTSLEGYRFHEGDNCPFKPEETAFVDGKLRCLEFRHEH